VLSALTGADPTETVGPGSWPDKPDLIKRKIDFVYAVLDKHKNNIIAESEYDRVRKIVAHVGGFDIAAILGAMLACVEFKKPEVDITQDMVPIQAHMSMGEGTGAILMVQMLKTTQHMFVNVGTFADLMKL